MYIIIGESVIPGFIIRNISNAGVKQLYLITLWP